MRWQKSNLGTLHHKPTQLNVHPKGAYVKNYLQCDSFKKYKTDIIHYRSGCSCDGPGFESNGNASCLFFLHPFLKIANSFGRYIAASVLKSQEDTKNETCRGALSDRKEVLGNSTNIFDIKNLTTLQ